MLFSPVQASYEISLVESLLRNRVFDKVVNDKLSFWLTVCQAVSKSPRPHPTLAEKFSVSWPEPSEKDKEKFRETMEKIADQLFFVADCQRFSHPSTPHLDPVAKSSVSWPEPSPLRFMTLKGNKTTIQKIQITVEEVRKFFACHLTESRPLTIIAVPLAVHYYLKQPQEVIEIDCRRDSLELSIDQAVFDDFIRPALARLADLFDRTLMTETWSQKYKVAYNAPQGEFEGDCRSLELYEPVEVFTLAPKEGHLKR